jgi:hypothetical protein
MKQNKITSQEIAKKEGLNYDYIKSQIDGLIFEYNKGKSGLIHYSYMKEKCDNILNFVKQLN